MMASDEDTSPFDRIRVDILTLRTCPQVTRDQCQCFPLTTATSSYHPARQHRCDHHLEARVLVNDYPESPGVLPSATVLTRSFPRRPDDGPGHWHLLCGHFLRESTCYLNLPRRT
jgi:hypothetical protein